MGAFRWIWKTRSEVNVKLSVSFGPNCSSDPASCTLNGCLWPGAASTPSTKKSDTTAKTSTACRVKPFGCQLPHRVNSAFARRDESVKKRPQHDPSPAGRSRPSSHRSRRIAAAGDEPAPGAGPLQREPPARDGGEVSALFSLAALTAAQEPPAAEPRSRPAADSDDSCVIDLGKLQQVQPSGASAPPGPARSVPLGPLVPPLGLLPLGAASTTPVPLETSRPSGSPPRRSNSAALAFAATAILSATVIATVLSLRHSATGAVAPSAAVAPSPSSAEPLTPAPRATASSPSEAEASHAPDAVSAPDASASASSANRRRPVKGRSRLGATRPDRPAQPRAAPSKPAPPAPRDPCAHCRSNDLACHMACSVR
jgi:hypothetical protein